MVPGLYYNGPGPYNTILVPNTTKIVRSIKMVREMSRARRPDGAQLSSSTRQNDARCPRTADRRARAYASEIPLTFLLGFRREFRRRRRYTARGRARRSQVHSSTNLHLALEFQVQPWRTRRRAAALTSRGNPSRGFSGDLGVSTCASTPPERVLLDLSQHLSTSLRTSRPTAVPIAHETR